MQSTTVLSSMRIALHANNPDINDIWLEGYESANDDIDNDDNPYPTDSEAHYHWQEGWWAGFYHEEPVFSYSKEKPVDNSLTHNRLRENLQHIASQLLSTPLSYTIAECRKICAFYVEKIVTAIIIALMGYEYDSVTVKV